MRCRHECGTALSALLRMGGRRQRRQQHAGVHTAECESKSPTVRKAVSLRSVTSQSGPATGLTVRDSRAEGVRDQIAEDETGAASRKQRALADLRAHRFGDAFDREPAFAAHHGATLAAQLYRELERPVAAGGEAVEGMGAQLQQSQSACASGCTFSRQEQKNSRAERCRPCKILNRVLLSSDRPRSHSPMFR